jgi:hypothetical protein
MPFPTGRLFPKKNSKDGWYSRGYLPHLDREGLTQLVSYRLWDSMPREVLETWEQELEQLPEKEHDLERRKRIDAYLDQG